MGYYEESLKTRSEKITLVTCEAVQRAKLFTLNGSDYERIVDHFVVGVRDSSTSLTKSTTLPLSLNQWHFNPKNKKLTINVGANPKTKNISLTYRFFFSNAPINLPYDLLSGEVVEWEPYITSIGQIGQQLDDQNTGIVLESSSSITLINSDKRFDSTFDTLIWENQEIKFYSWFPTIPISEKVQLFSGVIESKAFSESQVVFKVKDFVFKLKNQVNLGVFTNLDGTFLPSILSTPKRRIYGRVDKLKCISMEAILDGYLITGTITGALTDLTVTGTGTAFLDEVSPGDDVFVQVNGLDYKLGIETVDSDTQLTLSKELEVSFSASTIKVKPSRPWRKKNRKWHIAGHKLRAPSVEILIVQSSNTFLVADVGDFEAGDEVVINNIQSRVRRISGNKIITSTNIVPVPVAGDLIYKRPIRAVYKDSTLYSYARDYLETNSTEAFVTLDYLAEFNVAEQRKTGVSLVFTNGSRTITTSSTIDLRTIVDTRDWIRSTSATRSTWHEILYVTQQTIVLRTPLSFSGGPYTEEAYYKNIDPIDENSLITVDCLGMERSGVWIKTASDAVRDLVINDAGFLSVNETTFAKAKADCGHTVSIFLPEQIGSSSPLVRDVITKINDSVFGSLYGDSSQNISYSILNSTKPEVSDIIRDDDILSWTVDTNQKIANKVIVNYRPFVDVYNGEDAFKTYIFDSTFVDELIGIQNTIEKTIYLYDDESATVMAQRIALFNSLSVSSVKIKSKMNLSQVLVNDKIFLSLDRLCDRYAGMDQRKIGCVTGVKKDGFGTEISVTDLGNIYNRVPSIAPNTSTSYTTSNADDKIRWGYVLDNDVLTPDPTTEEGLGSGIIG